MADDSQVGTGQLEMANQPAYTPQLPPDLGSLQSILAQGVPPTPPPPGMQASPAGGMIPTQQQDLNLGTIPTQGGQQPQPKQAGPPQQGNVPAIYDFFHKLFGDQAARGYFPATGGGPGDLGAEPARPVSRLDAFQSFLGNFLSSFSQGMAQGGSGPAANARGFGAAVQAPYQRELQQYQLGQQQQLQQAQVGQQQAETELKYQQAQRVPVQPYGPTGPTVYMLPQEASRVYQSQIGAQARVQAAGEQKQYLPTQFGIFDTKKGSYVGGTGVGAGPMGMMTVTQDQVNQGAPKEWLGTQQKAQTVADMMNARSRELGVVQTGAGPQVVDKGLAAATGGRQGVTNLHLSPAADNLLARLKLNVATEKDLKPVQANQDQINLNLERLNRIRANADIINSAIDAGRIELAIGEGGKLQALAGRNVKLTAREAQFAADIQNMGEDINQLRIPLGAAGFRGAEGWAALQSQQGRLTQNPDVFRDVLDNTIQSFRAIQSSNQDAIDTYKGAMAVLNPGKNAAQGGGPPKPTPGKVPIIHFTPSKEK